MIPNFVLDTNVLISASLSYRSASYAVFRRAFLLGHVFYSEATLEELREKILLPKFDKYAPLQRRLTFLADYEFHAYPIRITETIEVCRDPKDNKFLELAVSGNADCIVSKDHDLLVLHPFGDIAILNVPQFLYRYSEV